VPNVMGVLRAEIRRLARKESRQELGALKKQITMMRRRLAESNRRIQGLEARARQLLRNGSAAPARGGVGGEDEGGKQVRFSAAWVRAHRKKLGMSRQLYARLVGVSAQTIMGWEAGRTRPRRAVLKTWREIRGKGVRELRAMLGGGEGAAAGRGARGRRRAGRKAVRKASRRVRARIGARVRRAVRSTRAVRVRRARVAKKK
jgi:transcriptional regulator with XRE-family HTH domain